MSSLAIESIEELKKLAYKENGDFVDFYIMLSGGLARSSKRISYDPVVDKFLIINEIDDSYQEVHSRDLEKETNIHEAISKYCLFKY